jgi:hypothetical protein
VVVARVLWEGVETLDLSEFYAGIAARESRPGRPMLDPKLLLGLWLLRQRAATAETVNADLRNRTMSRFTVRGRAKVRAVSLLAALTYNLLRAARLLAPN